MEMYFVLLMLFAQQSSAVIYRLDDAEYKRMPPLNQIDDYDVCLHGPDALYCTAQLELTSDTPNDLMNMIKNYSEWDLKHFNHSKIYRGVCVKTTCKMNEKDIRENLNNSLESCINGTIWKQYKLKTKLISAPNCYTGSRNIKLDFYDIIVGLTCVAIVVVNVVATIYDVTYKEPDTKGMHILLSFSLVRNWRRLKQCDYRMRQPVERLKGMDGIRAVMMIHFVFAHSIIPLVVIISNHNDFENMYSKLSCHILLNGSIGVQAYFVMAGILFSYNMQRLVERQPVTWRTVASNLFKRWLRLSPSLILCLAIASTWMRHLGSGPFWQMVGSREVEDCRRYWMWNFFFLTNYNTGSYCMPHTWYIAADMHLFLFGGIVVLVGSTYWRRVIMAAAFLLGILSSGIVTYLYDLRSLMTIKPNLLMETFVKDPNFDYLYKPTHTNIPAYVIGLATGTLIYRLQKSQFDIQRYKNFLVPFCLLVPSTYGLIILNSIHYRDGPALPLYVRVFHQMLQRPLIAAITAAGVFGFVFKIENVYRAAMEWGGWVCVARVAYTTYMTHFTMMRLIVGNWKTLNIFSKYVLAGGLTAAAFAVGVIVWLLLDSPVSHIVKLCMETPTKKENIAKGQ